MKNEINIFINDQLDGDKKVIKSLLTVPYEGNNKDKVFKIYDKNSPVFHASTRLGTLKKSVDGYEVDVTRESNIVGKSFALVEPGSRKVLLSGKIAQRKSEANIIDIKKAASGGK